MKAPNLEDASKDLFYNAILLIFYSNLNLLRMYSWEIPRKRKSKVIPPLSKTRSVLRKSGSPRIPFGKSAINYRKWIRFCLRNLGWWVNMVDVWLQDDRYKWMNLACGYFNWTTPFLLQVKRILLCSFSVVYFLFTSKYLNSTIVCSMNAGGLLGLLKNVRTTSKIPLFVDLSIKFYFFLVIILFQYMRIRISYYVFLCWGAAALAFQGHWKQRTTSASFHCIGLHQSIVDPCR